MEYLVMAKNWNIGTVEIDEFELLGFKPNPEYIPIKCFKDIKKFLYKRILPINRENTYKVQKLGNYVSLPEYLNVTHGVSLTDTIWFKGMQDNTVWDDICPYGCMTGFSKLNKHIQRLCLTGEYDGHSDLRTIAPCLSLDGSIDKAWKLETYRFYLYKTDGFYNGLKFGIRPYIEYYANQVARQLIDDYDHYVRYSIIDEKDTNGNIRPYVYCPSFTDSIESLLQYGDSKYADTDIKHLESTILGDRDREIVREMAVLDSIILNHDRHDLNYGFIIDSESFKIKRFAPIYDNDCSLGHFVSVSDLDNFQDGYEYALRYMPQLGIGDYIQQAQWAMTDRLYSNIKNMYPFKFGRSRLEVDIDDKRIEFMEYIVNSQLKAIINKI